MNEIYEPSGLVVNCFQITILVEDSQGNGSTAMALNCCELLSDYYFSRGFTGVSPL